MRPITTTLLIAAALFASLITATPLPMIYSDCVHDQVQRDKESLQDAQNTCALQSMINKYKMPKPLDSYETQEQVASHFNKDDDVDNEPTHLIKRQSPAGMIPAINQNKELLAEGALVGPCADDSQPNTWDPTGIALAKIGDVICKVDEQTTKRAEHQGLSHINESDNAAELGDGDYRKRDAENGVLKKRKFTDWWNNMMQWIFNHG